MLNHTLSCAVIAALFSLGAHAAYTVTLDPAGKSAPRFSLELPARHGDTLETRAARWGQPSQVVQPRCGKQALPPLGDGRWLLPETCRRVEWRVDFARPPQDASAQRSVAYPNWWLLAEAGSLLRLAGEPAPSTLTIKTRGQPDARAYVPGDDDAPEFYALGDTPQSQLSVSGVHVRYVADDIRRVSQRGLIERHAEALATLARLFPASSQAPQADQLLVVFLGNPDADKASGAGGARSLLADYPQGSAGRDTFLQAMLAHEQFHQLAALHRVGGGSTWFSEGLAHYYGLKAMRAGSAPAAEKDKVWAMFVDPQRPVDATLTELERRFAAGDGSVYPLFYQQGATFFAELERTLREASGGQRSLDDFVPRLRANADGTLDQALQDALRAAAGERVDALLERYVGRP